MKRNFEDISFDFTMIIAITAIVLNIIALIFKVIIN
jgi:hypothetical protein